MSCLLQGSDFKVDFAGDKVGDIVGAMDDADHGDDAPACRRLNHDLSRTCFLVHPNAGFHLIFMTFS